MPAPANDNRADAELVPDPDTLYWGIVTGGTTVDATDEDLGPLHDVWYAWETDLPEGNVYLYVEPHAGALTDLQYTARLYSATPADADFSVPFSQASGFIGDPTATLRLQLWHIGGPLALQVFTNTEDDVVGDIDFDFGWGHDLDVDASHWGATTQDDWGNTQTDLITGASLNAFSANRLGNGSTFGLTTGTTVPSTPADGDCAWGNARDGADQVASTSPTDPDNCTYIGPAGGALGLSGIATIQDVGAGWAAQSLGGNLPSPPFPPATPGTSRNDVFVTSQLTWAWRLGDAHRGTITLDDTPAGTPADEGDITPASFAAYRASQNPKRAWGYDYTEPLEWATRDFKLTGNVGFSTDTDADHVESPSIVANLISADVTISSSSSDSAFDNPSLTPDTVYLHVDSGLLDYDASYVSGDVALGGTTIAALGNDAATAVDYLLGADEATAVALMVESTDDTDGARWLVAAVFDSLVAGDTRPTVYTPTRDGPTVRTERSQAWDGAVPNLNWDYRLPQWRPYLGFPLTSGAWYIGRLGSGGQF